MKKIILSLLVLVLMAGMAWAQAPVVNPGWSAFIIRNATSSGNPPEILDNDTYVVDSLEMRVPEPGQKIGLGTDALNGAKLSQISTLHVDRLDILDNPGIPWGPYFNIWITDGLGNYAVVANEPSNAEWASNRWDVANWDYLKTKTCKIYETVGWNTNSSWAHAYALNHGWSGAPAVMTFEHLGGLTIEPPSTTYIAAGNGVGGGAPDEIGTNIARGYNWLFGDSLNNYSTPGLGYVVNNYYATANFSVTNVTQGLGYSTIGAAMAAAVAGNDITVAAGTYPENVVIPVGVTLRSLAGAGTTTIAGTGGTAVAINADNVEIFGFTITNPTGTNAITAQDRSGLHIHDNVITNIGTSGVNSPTTVHSVAVVCSAQPVDDVVIEDNDFSNIGSAQSGSSTAIAVGWSTGAQDVTNLVIENNTISLVRANTNTYPTGGRGAYGIIINHGTGVTGKTVGAKVLNNSIDDLEGLWSHGIGLEGNTPGALVDGNTISNLVDHKMPSDAVAIMVEDNASLGSVTIVDNTFMNVAVGIANVETGPDFVNAINNNWGDPSGPFNPFQNPNGTGAAVGGKVLYTPWTGRATTVVADLGIDPSSKTLGADGYGYWEGTLALGLDDDYAAGFAPGALQANVTAADPLKYTKYGFVPSAIFGRNVFVGELHAISYFTQKGTTHVANPADWFCQMYTVGSAHGWYGERINAEPYFSENLTETPGEWTEWRTAAGENNRLRFFDSNLSFGSYTDGFLQDLTNNPGYADQPIMLFGLGLGTAWAEGFDGKLDGLTVELVSGEIATFNFTSGNTFITVTPAATGPVACGTSGLLTVSLVTDAYTPDVFGVNTVINLPAELAWGTITSLAPFGATTQFFSADEGGGSRMISVTTTGSPTEPITTAGTTPLFTVAYTTASEGVAAVTFDSFNVRDPYNAPIPSVVTGATITVDCTAPAAVTAINAAPGHNKVDVTWSHSGTDVDHYDVFSGLWYAGSVGTSAYPEYDDLANDVIPAVPGDYATAFGSTEWDLLTGTAALSLTETWPNANDRGVYYYTVFAVDAAGNKSPAPAAIDRATNYWLGDVSPIDGLVGVADFTALGTAFGTSEAGGGNYNNIIDVGPTDDWSRLGIPTTDSKINFEDLMIFSLNFGVVTSAKDAAPISKVVDLAWVSYENGDMGLRLVNGTGVKGVHVRADRPVSRVQAGQLLDDQSELTFLQNVGANLDVSVAVMGLNQGFEGTGDLFVVSADDALLIEDLHITVRSTENKNLAFTMDTTSGTLTPRVFSLNANYPNPFNPMTKISFSLPETQDVQLVVFGVDGRKVATLLNETRGPGLHEVVWTGRDDDGQTVASGLYFYRVDAGPYSQVRKMTLMK